MGAQRPAEGLCAGARVSPPPARVVALEGRAAAAAFLWLKKR